MSLIQAHDSIIIQKTDSEYKYSVCCSIEHGSQLQIVAGARVIISDINLCWLLVDDTKSFRDYLHTHESLLKFEDETTESRLKDQVNKDDQELLKLVPIGHHRNSLAFILNEVPDIRRIFEKTEICGDSSVTPKDKVRGSIKRRKSHLGSVNVRKCNAVLPLDGKYYLIYGKTQSGKTGMIQCISLSHIILTPCSCLIILDNSVDGNTQLQDRCEDFVNKHRSYSKTQGKSIEYLYVGKSSESDLIDAFSGKTKKMIVSLANVKQITKITECLSHIDNPKFACCIDEADSIVCGNEGAAFREKIPGVFERAGRIYTVTATAFDLLFTQDQIDSANSIVLKTKTNSVEGRTTEIYKGIRQIQKYCLDDKTVPTNGHNPLWVNDLQLHEYLTFYSNKTVYGEHMGHNTYHMPIIALIKNSHLKSKQLELAKLIQSDDVLGKIWCTIIYNSNGITVYCPEVKSIKINGRQGVENECGYTFPSLCVKHGLQYLKELNETGVNITHIAMIAGDLADRGISFVSKDYGWHINHMYYIPSNGTSVSNLLQAAGRLTGNFNDDVPLILHTTRWAHDEIIKGYEIQEEAISRCRELGGKMRNNILEHLTFEVEKMPRKKLGRVSDKFMKATKDKPDNGWNTDVYRNALSELKVPDFVAELKKEICDTMRSAGQTDTLKGATTFRKICVDKITSRAINQKEIYDVSINELRRRGINKWYKRSLITSSVCIDVGKSRANVEGVWRALFETKSTSASEYTNGLVMTKVDDSIWMRLNE